MSRWSRTLTNHVDAASVDAGWERVRRRRARPRVVRQAMIAAPILAFAAVLVLVVRGWLLPAHVAAVTVTAVTPPPVALAPIALTGGAPIPAELAAPMPAPSTVSLDDGSRIELAPLTHVKSTKAAPDRVELAVETGRATFDVKPGGPRTWVIDAGTVTVRVLGTRFTVAREGDAVEVTVERGKVQVTTATGTRLLLAGESFNSAPPALTTTPAPTPAPALAPTRAPALALAPAPPPEDPMRRADTLRRAGHPAEAATLLRSVVDTNDRRASLAAFTLGKLHAEDLADPSSAARWFERAVALGLPSGLDEEAQARVVECHARAGERGEASRAAARYEARFPEGRQLARVKEWAHD